MNTIKNVYGHVAKKLIRNSIQPSAVEPGTVFQKANKLNRNILNKEIIRDLIHPESDILNFSQIQRLSELSQKGYSCLIVMEHYSNFDFPNFLYLLESKKNISTISEGIIAIAGMKLNTESDFVRAFTEAYTRIMIYPSRSLTPHIGSDNFAREQARSRKINRAALHEMVRQKHSGKIILIFPTGTRYREGLPETRRGLEEVDSYIKGFDYFLPVAIAGNILRININGGMSDDYVHEDCVIFQAGNLIEARKWRNDARSLASEHQNPKQYVADCIMNLLEELHNEAERQRRSIIT